MFRSEDVPVSLIGVLLNEMVERVETEFAFVSGLDCGRAVSAIESNESDVPTFFFPKDGSEELVEIKELFVFFCFVSNSSVVILGADISCEFLDLEAAGG